MAYAGTTYLSGAEASTVRARVARILPHPLYNADTADFDVAVLRLDSPLPFGRHVQPVCLPAATHVFPPRRRCLISGWGYLREDFRKCCARRLGRGVGGPNTAHPAVLILCSERTCPVGGVPSPRRALGEISWSLACMRGACLPPVASAPTRNQCPFLPFCAF